ncbi:MAG: tetratricopeptide repeat protein [Patescibacteria group bacterium]
MKFDYNNPVIWYNLALAQNELGEFEESLISCQKSLDNLDINYTFSIVK